MMTTNDDRPRRTDAHRPSVMDPTEYEWVLSFAYPGPDGDPGYNMRQLGDLRVANRDRFTVNRGGCDICGNGNYLEGAVFRHVPTGDMIQVGHICAAKVELFAGDAEGLAAAREERRRLSLTKRDRRNRWSMYREVLTPELRRLFRVGRRHEIVADIRGRFRRSPFRCAPTERQVALMTRLVAEIENPKPAELHVPVPAENGERITVEGTVVSIKVSEGMYGTTVRMTVKVETPDGSWLVNGTLPTAIDDATRGDIVRFSATIQHGREPHFAFFKRPTKAQVVAASIGTPTAT